MDNIVIGDFIITPEMLIGFFVACIAVALVAVFCEHVLKTLLIVIVIVMLAVFLGAVKPDQLQNLGEAVRNSTEKIQEIKQLSDNSQTVDAVVDNNGELSDLKIYAGGQWFSVDDLEKVVKVNDDTITFTVGGKSFTVEDDSISQLVDIVTTNTVNDGGLNSVLEAIDKFR